MLAEVRREEPPMNGIFRIAGAVLILLAVLEAAFGTKLELLPIGGSHIAQTTVVLGLALFITEMISVFRS
jgi:hypothetical protein